MSPVHNQAQSRAPGRRTLTDGLRRPQKVAEQGFVGSPQALPHLDRIQAAFGRHDVSGAQAFVGGAADKAAASMGASAYTTGNQVGFRRQPDLHTAAHEAAHVIQQRQGVQLKSELDTPGDSYEQQADAIADKVVRGESAEELLDQTTRGGSPAVQRHPDDGSDGAAPWSEEEIAEQGAQEAQTQCTEPVDLTAVDETDTAGWLESLFSYDEVTEFTDAESMVNALNEKANGCPIGSLEIEDHGTPGSQHIGNQRITTEALEDPELRAELQQLQFAPDGEVKLGGCRVAKGERGEAFLKEMAELWGVPVSGGVTPQNSYPGYEGTTVTCYPPDAEGEQECVTDESWTPYDLFE